MVAPQKIKEIAFCVWFNLALAGTRETLSLRSSLSVWAHFEFSPTADIAFSLSLSTTPVLFLRAISKETLRRRNGLKNKQKIQFVCDAKKISKALKHCCWTTVLRTSPSAIGALLCFIVQLQWSSTCRQPEHSPPLYPVQHQTVYCIYITPSRLLMYLYLYYSIQEGCWCICSCILYLSALNCRENIKCSSYFTERQHHLVKMWKAGK